MSDKKTQLYSIEKATVNIKTEIGQVLGPFAVSSIHTNFILGSLPTCSVTLMSGYEFTDNPSRSQDIIRNLLEMHSRGSLSIEVYLSIRNVKISGGSANTSAVKDIKVFSGIVSSVSISSNARAMGGSRSGVVVNAYHRFAELYRFGANGMVYLSPSKIATGDSLYELIQRASAVSNNAPESTNSFQSKIIEEVLAHGTPDLNAKSNKKCDPLPILAKDLIDRMYKAKLIKPDTPKAKVESYIDGSPIPVKFTKTLRSFIKTYLNSIWDGISSSTLGASLLTACTSSNLMLTVAPRSTEKLTVIPADGSMFLRKSKISIGTSRYTSINYSRPEGVFPKADGVIVTHAGSNLFSKKSFNTNSMFRLVSGRYPNSSSSVDIRWMPIPAPSWFSNEDIINSSRTKNDSKNSARMSDSDTALLCNMYAKAMYYKLKNKDSVCVLDMDIRSLEAYGALGASCVINTTQYGDLEGIFSGYSMSYTQSASSSNISISTTFSHMGAYANIDKDQDVLYSIDMSKEPSKFPDLDDKFNG